MARLDKETIKGFSWIEAEIYNAQECEDMKRLKNLKKRIANLQELTGWGIAWVEEKQKQEVKA